MIRAAIGMVIAPIAPKTIPLPAIAKEVFVLHTGSFKQAESSQAMPEAPRIVTPTRSPLTNPIFCHSVQSKVCLL